jgi:hypothetical protein
VQVQVQVQVAEAQVQLQMQEVQVSVHEVAEVQDVQMVAQVLTMTQPCGRRYPVSCPLHCTELALIRVQDASASAMQLSQCDKSAVDLVESGG